MNTLLFILCVVLSAALVISLLKIYSMRKSMEEIRTEFQAKLKDDTNTLITLTAGDKKLRQLAAQINRQLMIIRKKELKYRQGDQELKDAVTNISHDLRTPLTAVCGYMALLKKEDLSPQAQNYLSVIENRIAALKKLTEELFRYSVAISVQEYQIRETVSLNACLEESIAAFYVSLNEAGIIPQINIPEEKIKRVLNKNALSRIFENILNNALKYSDGDLIISLDLQGQICFTNTASHLDEISAGNLFNRFFTVETGRNSTGLGLAISKMLTEELGGTITASWNDQKLTICLSF